MKLLNNIEITLIAGGASEQISEGTQFPYRLGVLFFTYNDDGQCVRYDGPPDGGKIVDTKFCDDYYAKPK